MARVLTITANTLIDHLAEATIVAGKVNRTARFTAVAGGKALNMARVLARHGHHVIAAGFAGAENGEQLARLAAADGLEPAFTTTAARTRLGFLAVQADGGTTSLMENGFEVTPDEVGALVQRVRALLADDSGSDGRPALVLIGGSVPHPSCVGLYRTILADCAAAGVPCWVDAYGPAMDEALAGAHPPALAKPNREEYAGADALGNAGHGGRKWLACGELHLTDGSGTVRVRHPDGRFRVTPPKVQELNAIGSGDCYVAALAAARLSGAPLIEQLRYAAAAGAANAARADVARIGPAEIRALLDRVEVVTAGDDA